MVKWNRANGRRAKSEIDLQGQRYRSIGATGPFFFLCFCLPCKPLACRQRPSRPPRLSGPEKKGSLSEKGELPLLRFQDKIQILILQQKLPNDLAKVGPWTCCLTVFTGHDQFPPFLTAEVPYGPLNFHPRKHSVLTIFRLDMARLVVNNKGVT